MPTTALVSRSSSKLLDDRTVSITFKGRNRAIGRIERGAGQSYPGRGREELRNAVRNVLTLRYVDGEQNNGEHHGKSTKNVDPMADWGRS